MKRTKSLTVYEVKLVTDALSHYLKDQVSSDPVDNQILAEVLVRFRAELEQFAEVAK